MEVRKTEGRGGAHLVKDMITGYHRDDVRSSCDVWATSRDDASQQEGCILVVLTMM